MNIKDMHKAWKILIVVGVFEVGFAVGFAYQNHYDVVQWRYRVAYARAKLKAQEAKWNAEHPVTEKQSGLQLMGFSKAVSGQGEVIDSVTVEDELVPFKETDKVKLRVNPIAD